MLAKLKFLPVAVALLALGLGSAQAQTPDDGAGTGEQPISGDAPESSPTVAAAPPVELKVGPAHTAGLVSFVLATQANGDSVAVEAVVSEAMDADAKAAVVAAAVANADPTGAWTASHSAGKLTFKHLVGELWQDVDLITSYSDTTGSGTKIESVDKVVSFTLALDEAAVAVGYDGMGEPSFIMVTVTDTLTYTRALQGGETAQAVLDSLQAFLAAEAGEGVAVTRTSANALTITLRYEDSQVNWQMTDLGLESGAKAEALSVEQNGNMIRRDR